MSDLNFLEESRLPVDSRSNLPATTMRHWLNRMLTPPLMLVAALILFAEEVLWEAAKRLMAQFN